MGVSEKFHFASERRAFRDEMLIGFSVCGRKEARRLGNLRHMDSDVPEVSI
jgi:hypothetical protein